jgi:colicin import membrane protein
MAAARRALIDRPRGATELADKQYAADAESAAKIINIKASAAEKANAAEEEAANRIAKIDEEQTLRNIERATASAMDEGAARDAALARLNALDAAAQLARNDAREESAEKIRVADTDAANAIIDAQEEAVVKKIDAEKAAALALLDQQTEVKKEEAPPGWETFSKFGKRGEVIEGSADRKAREERNREAEANAKRERDIRRVGIEREYDERKRQAEDQLEAQRPTLIGLKRTHEVQQEEHVKAVEAEKGRTEADEDFAKAHKGLGMPEEPGKAPKGKADVSIKVVADILSKIWDSINIGNSHFEGVFMAG